jgi:hypothetical protein
MMMVILSMTIKCTLSASHFDGHGHPLVQYKVHCPMQHVQGYTGSPLDTTIGQLLALYCPSKGQGISKQNNDKNMNPLCWPF